MKLKAIWTLALLCAVVQGLWAQTSVKSEKELKDAITDGANIQLAADIQLSNYLDIDHKSVTIDLNGHKLSRNLSEHNSAGHVIWVHGGSNLTLTSTAESYGSIEGGMANNGGAIHIPHGNEVSVNRVTFRNNSAAEHAGAIWNNGKFTAILCTFENNTAGDVGAVYNSVTSDGAGTAILDNCTFTGNAGTAGAGALANALGATVMELRSCNLTGNTAGNHGGAVWNGGTLTVTRGTFANNTAKDVGAIYNAVSTDGSTAGNATLEYCTFTGNTGTAGAGALANALGATVMTIEDCTITGNTAETFGAGIWNGGTLNMKGEVKVTDNTNASGLASNVYLKSGNVITLAGQLYTSDGPTIGVELENTSGTFTSGYDNYHREIDPSTFFTADLSIVVNLGLDNKGEACLNAIADNPVYYIERSWDEENMQVVSQLKGLAGLQNYDAIPIEGQYKEVIDDPGSWFRMGGFDDNVAEYYVVHGNVNRETIVVLGKNVHLILCDKATLTLTGGLKLEGDTRLYIHSQSYGDYMGRLMVTNSHTNAAGIGSAQDNGAEKTVGELVIHGGHIEATGGQYGAGIGSCARIRGGKGDLCNRVTVYGGYVKAQGGESGAGIGGGSGYNNDGIKGGEFILYDGTVIAIGDSYGSGVGGGGAYYPGLNNSLGQGGQGGDVTVYGGSLTATGGHSGAGIGSGKQLHDTYAQSLFGGTFTMYGGTVSATGGEFAAGIGGGFYCGGATVRIYDGTVTAKGGFNGAGIGGGQYGYGGAVSITGGTVTAYGGSDAAGIGGGQKGNGGLVNIIGGTVIAKAGTQGGTGNRAIGPGSGKEIYGSLGIGDQMMVGAGNNGSVESIFDADERVNACWYRSYAEISPCTHPGATYTVDGIDANGTHTLCCRHCTTTFAAENHTFENDKCIVCGVETGLNISLADNCDNDGTLTLYNGLTVNSVTLTGRTLYRDGKWNTLCLPFDLTDSDTDAGHSSVRGGIDGKTFTGTQLEGAEVMGYDHAEFDSNSGTLELIFAPIFKVLAGEPVLIRWTKSNPSDPDLEDLVNPVFSGVTIDNSATSQGRMTNSYSYVDFVGTFSPIDIFTEDKTNLYLGADNLLYYPSGKDMTSFTINSFRAYFELKNGLTADEPATTEGQNIKSFVLNFGEETGIEEVNGSGFMGNGSKWYTLDGLRIGEKPLSPGLYIHNGRKVLIK